jgi:hypothetical protein
LSHAETQDPPKIRASAIELLSCLPCVFCVVHVALTLIRIIIFSRLNEISLHSSDTYSRYSELLSPRDLGYHQMLNGAKVVVADVISLGRAGF